MKFDIGCGYKPKEGYIGIDPILGKSFFKDCNPYSQIEELLFMHSIYMLGDEKFNRKTDMNYNFIKNKVKSYLKNEIAIFDLNKELFGESNFHIYYNALKNKLQDLVLMMPSGGKIVIEQPILKKMAHKTNLLFESYRILRYKTSSLKQAIISEFFKTHNFMTCDEILLTDLLRATGFNKIEVRDGVLDWSKHYAKNCIVVIGTK